MTEKKRFNFRTKDELQKKVWIGLPDCDFQLFCTQILATEMSTATRRAQTPVFDEKGDYLTQANGELIRQTNGDMIQQECIRLIVEHTSDWKGAEVTSGGKHIPYTDENLDTFLNQIANERIEISETETTNVVMYFTNQLCDANNFIHGDVKNLKPTSPKE